MRSRDRFVTHTHTRGHISTNTHTHLNIYTHTLSTHLLEELGRARQRPHWLFPPSPTGRCRCPRAHGVRRVKQFQTCRWCCQEAAPARGLRSCTAAVGSGTAPATLPRGEVYRCTQRTSSHGRRAGSNRGVSRPRRGGGASSGAMASFGRFRSWPITAARVLEPQLKEMGLRVPVCVATAAADAYMMLASTRAGRVRARGEWLH